MSMEDAFALDAFERSQLLGREFLTWLWAMTELERGQFDLDGLDTIGLMVDDEIVLADDADDGGVDILRAGDPALSDEAAAALRSGKKARQLRMHMVRGTEETYFTLDQRLQLRGVRLPRSAEEHPSDILADQLEGIRFLGNVVDALYTRFVELRLGDGWSAEVRKLSRWIEAK